MSKATEFAKQAMTLASVQRYACLSTISRAAQIAGTGFPFGSVVPYRLTRDGSPVIYISKIAEHYKNLEADTRASLLVTAAFVSDAPLSSPRLTILARFKPLALSDCDSNIHQGLISLVPREIAASFVTLAGDVERLRWIGGFGEVGWIDFNEWKEAFAEA